MKTKIKISEIRNKTISNLLFSNTLDSMLLLFNDNTYTVIGIKNHKAEKLNRVKFNKQLIDIFLPENCVAAEVEDYEPQTQDSFYGRYWSQY